MKNLFLVILALIVLFILFDTGVIFYLFSSIKKMIGVALCFIAFYNIFLKFKPNLILGLIIYAVCIYFINSVFHIITVQ